MTDNEKRAHDLAIVMIPLMYDINVNNAMTEDVKELNFDGYQIYQEIYPKVLKLFNADYPNEK